MLHVIVGLADARGIERIGFNDVRPSGKIFAVDVRHDVGAGQAEQVVVSLHLPGYFFKEFAAEIGLCQVVSLYHGAHRTVKNKDASAHQVFQFHKIGFIV